MAKTELKPEELSKAAGGISLDDGQKLASKLEYFFNQGRLGINQFNFIQIYEDFQNGDDKTIEGIFEKYRNNSSDFAWTELYNMYIGFKNN